MNKYLTFLMRSVNKCLAILLCAFMLVGFVSCKDDEPKPIDFNLMPGIWEVTHSGDNKMLNLGDILDLSISSQSAEGVKGDFTIYWLTSTGKPLYSQGYTWNIRDIESAQPLLDIVMVADLDTEEPWAGNYYYRITKLTDTHMWWQGNTNGNSATIMMKRRTDLSN